MKKPIVAILYDFDKTLSTTDMQDYGFIPALGMQPNEFWGATGEFTAKTGVERILSYMWMMKYLAKEKGIKLTRKTLNSYGKDIKYFPGVETWFKRINEFGNERGVRVEHYLLSSGTKEIVEGCSIAKEFKEIYGCEFYFDPVTEEPIWPKLAINYTQKTQYFFRIHKGAIDIGDDAGVNERKQNNRVEYENMIYLGDGMTDVPCMMLIKQNGGHSIAIYQKGDHKNIQQLVKDKRINFACKANYTEGSLLDKTVKLIISNASTRAQLFEQQKELYKKILKEG